MGTDTSVHGEDVRKVAAGCVGDAGVRPHLALVSIRPMRRRGLSAAAFIAAAWVNTAGYYAN